MRASKSRELKAQREVLAEMERVAACFAQRLAARMGPVLAGLEDTRRLVGMYAFGTFPQFRNAGPAAVALINYLDDHPDLSSSSWDFERGTASSNGQSRAWAEFSQEGATDRFKRVRVAISLIKNPTGGWHFAHAVTPA